MSPPVNNVPPLAHARTANAGLQGGKFSQCSAAWQPVSVEHLLVHFMET